MSASRPARCLLLTSSRTSSSSCAQFRTLHTSLSLRAKKKPKAPSIKASEKDLMKSNFPYYTPDEATRLAQKYTPAQLKAIEAGEEAIDLKDLDTQGVIRTDIGALDYLEDLSKTKPAIDRKRHYSGPIDPYFRPMVGDEDGKEYVHQLAQVAKDVDGKHPTLPEDADAEDEETIIQYNKDKFPNRIHLMTAESRLATSMGTNGPIPFDNDIDYTSPGLPAYFDEQEKKTRVEGEESEEINPDDEEQVEGKEVVELDEDVGDEPDPRDPDGRYNTLINASGLTLDEILNYKIKILVQHSVSNQTRLGKVRSIYCLAIAGDKNGRLGIGEAKGETENIADQARIKAIKNMKYVPRYENRTIFGDVEGKQSAVEVQLMARPPAGIHDIAARVPRSRNPMNTVKAVYKALLNQRLPEEIALARGKKLVDVRKVYYGGCV